MEKPGFVGLGVKRACGRTGTGWHADDDIGLLSPAVMNFSEVVHDLVETHAHKVCKLHLDHGFVAFDREAKACADDGAFAKWGIAHSIASELGFEAIGNFENSSIFSDVLTHEDQVRIFFHGLTEPIADGIDEALFGTWALRSDDYLGKWCIDICQFFLQVWRDGFLGKGDLQGIVDRFFDLFIQFLFGRRIENPNGFQIGFVIVDRIELGPFFHQVLGNVLGAGGFLVAAHAEGDGFDQYRSWIFADIFR